MLTLNYTSLPFLCCVCSCLDSFPFAMITLRWEQMERALEMDQLVVAVLHSLDQLPVAPNSSFYGFNAPLFCDFLL